MLVFVCQNISICLLRNCYCHCFGTVYKCMLGIELFFYTVDLICLISSANFFWYCISQCLYRVKHFYLIIFVFHYIEMFLHKSFCSAQ